MSHLTAEQLANIVSFPKLVEMLRDELQWPIEDGDELEDVVFEYEADELGLKPDEVAKVREIHQLRPLVTNQPWGVFFISFDEKEMSVTVLRRVLKALVVKKRAGMQAADRQAWDKSDLIFAANFGQSGERELAFVHFSDGADTGDLPVMKVLGWNAKDTKLHNEYAAKMLTSRLAWPDDESDDSAWRKQWSSAFEIGHRQVIKTSRELALHLAGLATQIRARANELLEAEAEDGPMRTMLEAFRKNLIHDLDEDGFADMFAQTICYGMLAAAISRESGALVADNMADMVPRTNPFLKELFANFLKLGGRDKRSNLDFDELGVREVVDMLSNADMPAVLRDFGDRNPKEDPVIHFYELFLKEYDPAKRMQRGVFYTPRPVVNFIVRGVDEILRAEFDLPLGLADTTTWGQLAERNEKITIPDHIDPDQPFVQILDPATGTGTFLVEVIDLIHKRMVEHWQGEGKSKAEIAEAWNEYVPVHLLPRLTAFELMMAPYSIAHMKVGLKLTETGYKFDSDERARIFLTNALEPAKDLNMQFDFMSAALAHEAKAANEAKEKVPFTVVIGNPPYAGHSKNNNIPEIVELVYDYKRDWPELLKPGQGKWLQDDYVKFIRFAQSTVDRTTLGVLGYITNHSYFDNPTFKGMRSKLRQSFQQIRILDLHGNVKKKEKAPDGSADGGVFEDVAQGVAITEAIKLPGLAIRNQLWRDDLFGSVSDKLDYLIDTGSRIESKATCPIIEPECFFYPVDTNMKAEWKQFLGVPEVMSVNGDPAPGIVTTHDQFAVSFTSDEQIEKVEWLVATSSEEEARERFRLCTQNQWAYENAKRSLADPCWKEDIVEIAYRPFDERVTAYNNQIAVHLRDRVMRHMLDGANVGLSTVRGKEIIGGWEHVFVFSNLIQHHSVSSKEVNYLFPLWLDKMSGDSQRRANIGNRASRRFSSDLGMVYNDGNPRAEQQSMGADYRHQRAEQIGLLDQPWDGRGDLEKDFGPRDLFDWIYAILHAPSYRSRYAEFLKSNFPRIPIPKDRATFAALVPLGRRLVALHLLDPEDEPILKSPDIRFAGTGEARVQKGYPKYRNGKVEINANRWFEDVPKETWEFHVGGYQVCDKWLKDRAGKGGQNPRPGRVLTEEDILHYRRVVTALTETRKIMAEIDSAIEKHGGWPGAFAISEDEEGSD